MYGILQQNKYHENIQNWGQGSHSGQASSVERLLCNFLYIASWFLEVFTGVSGEIPLLTRLAIKVSIDHLKKLL